MVARRETHQGTDAAAGPPVFAAAVAAMRAATLRPEVFCEQMPAPQRIAPWASALSADVTVDGDEVATGRIVLLHDPSSPEAWAGDFRCVAYCRAEIDDDLADDPMLADVGWSWLVETLEAHGASYAAASGTVTRVTTETFGSMSEDEGSAQLEIRASWTPTDPPEIAAHVEAWGELLCTAGGLHPVPDGVAVLPSQRGQRGTDG